MPPTRWTDMCVALALLVSKKHSSCCPQAQQAYANHPRRQGRHRKKQQLSKQQLLEAAEAKQQEAVAEGPSEEVKVRMAVLFMAAHLGWLSFGSWCHAWRPGGSIGRACCRLHPQPFLPWPCACGKDERPAWASQQGTHRQCSPQARLQAEAWRSAVARAGGDKVLDDPKLLRRSLKKEVWYGAAALL